MFAVEAFCAAVLCLCLSCLVNLIIDLPLTCLSVCPPVCLVCSILALFPCNLAGIDQSTIVLLHGGDEAIWARQYYVGTRR